MKRIIESKGVAITAFCIVIAYLILTFNLRFAWWSFIDVFFAFMMTFTHLTGLLLAKLNPFVRRKMDTCSMICGILFIISFIVEYILYNS